MTDRTAENDLEVRLHRFGLAEWIRRDDPAEKIQVSNACVDALDRMQEQAKEIARLRVIAAAADRLLNGIYEFADHGQMTYLTERIQALDDALDKPAADVLAGQTAQMQPGETTEQFIKKHW